MTDRRLYPSNVPSRRAPPLPVAQRAAAAAAIAAEQQDAKRNAESSTRTQPRNSSDTQQTAVSEAKQATTTTNDARKHVAAANDVATPIEAEPQQQQRALTRSLQKEQAAERRQEERDKRPAQPQPAVEQQVIPQLQPVEAEPRHQSAQTLEESKPAPEQPQQQQQQQQQSLRQPSPQAASMNPDSPQANSQPEPEPPRVKSSKLRAPRQYDRPDETRQSQQPDSHRQRQREHSQKVAFQLQEQQEEIRSYQQRLHQRAASRDDERMFRLEQQQRRMHPSYAASQQHMHLAMAKPSPHLAPMLHQPAMSMQSQVSPSSRSGVPHHAHPQLQPLMHLPPQVAFTHHSRHPSHPSLEHLSYNETGLMAPLTYSDLHRYEAAQQQQQHQQQQQLQHSASTSMLLQRVAAPAPLMHHSQTASYLPPSAWSASSDLHALQLQAENDALIMQQQYRLQLAHQREQQQQALEMQQQQQQAAAAAAMQQAAQQQALMRQQLLAAQSAASFPLAPLPLQLAPVALPPPQPQPQPQLSPLPSPPPQPQPQPTAPAPQQQPHPAVGMDTMAQLTSLLLAQLLAAQANGGPSSLHHANLLAQGARLPPVSARAHPQPAVSASTPVNGKKKKTQVGWSAAVAPLASSPHHQHQQAQANAVQLGGNPETRSLSADLVIAHTRQDAAMSKHVQRAAQRKLAEAAQAAAIAAEDAAAKAKRDADFNKRLMAQRRARARLDAGHERVKAAALTAEVAQMHSLGLIGDGSAAHPFKFPGPQNGQRSQAALGSQETQQTREAQPYIDEPMHRTPAPRARARDRERDHDRDHRPHSPRTEPKQKQAPRLYAPSSSNHVSPPPRKPHRQTDGPSHFMKFSGGGHASGARGLLGVFSTYEADRSIPGRGQQMTWIQKWTAQQREQARKGRQGISPLRALKADGGAASPPRFRDPSEFKPRAQQRSVSVQPLPSIHSKADVSSQRTPPRSRPRSHSPPRTQRSARRRESQTLKARSPPRSRARTPPPRPKQDPVAASPAAAVSPVHNEAPLPSPSTPQPAVAAARLTAPAPTAAVASPVPAPIVVTAAPAPAIVVASPTHPSEPASPVQPSPASATLQQAREEYSQQLAALEAAKQLQQDVSSTQHSRSHTENSPTAAAITVTAPRHHSPRPEAAHSPVHIAVAAAAVVAAPIVVSPPPPSQPTPPPLAVLRSSDELLTASTAHASMFPDSSGISSGSSPLNRQLSTAASSSSPSGSQGLTEFHKLIKQKSVAQRVVHEDGTDEIITTTTTVHRNSNATVNSNSSSRAISRTQSIALNSSGSMPLLLDSLESAPYASVSRTRSLRIQAPPSPLAQQSTPQQLQSIPGTPPTPPARSNHLSPMRHLLHQQPQASSTPGATASQKNAPTEYNVSSLSPHAAAAVAAITEQALLRRASSVLVPPAADEEDADEENEETVAARTQEKERSLLRRKQTYNFEIEDMPEEHSERSQSHSRSASDSQMNGSTDREQESPAFVTAAATAAIPGSDPASRGKLWHAPDAPDARRKSALVKPHLWSNPATNQTVSAVLKNAAMSDEDKQAFLASRPQRQVAGGKSNPLLRGIPSPQHQQAHQRRPSNVVAGTGSSATPIVPQRNSSPQPSPASKQQRQPKGSSSRNPSRSPPPPNHSPNEAKPRSKPSSSSATANKHAAASKYEVTQQSPLQPVHRKAEEEEKQQQQPVPVAAVSVQAAPAAASSTASISTTISDDSDLSGDYSDDAFVALTARGSVAPVVGAVTKTALTSVMPSKQPKAATTFDPARTASSIERSTIFGR